MAVFSDYIGEALASTMKNREVVMYHKTGLSSNPNPVLKKLRLIPDIKNVIFNPPATIIFWEDGTKTVVKCSEYDDFDPEKGMAMAIAKKAIGEGNNYYPEIKKWTKNYDYNPVDKITLTNPFSKIGESIRKGFLDGLSNIHVGNDIDGELNK